MGRYVFNPFTHKLDDTGIVGGAGGTIDSITGNTGGAVFGDGSGNVNIVTANTTVKFAGTANTETEDFGISNLLMGSSGPSIAGATNNVGLGLNALNALTAGVSNTAVGSSSLSSYTTGSANAGSNVSIGASALTSLTTGKNNISIGASSSSAYVGAESSNICIGNAGVAAESNVIRIGTQGTGTGQQTDCYLAGVLRTSSGRVIKVTTPGAYPYTALTTDYLILVDTTSARTINLLATPETGRTYVIKDNVGSASINNITVSGNGANIDGASTYVIITNYASITVIYNGTTWSVV